MDIGQAFGYISEDKEWVKKVLLGAVIGAIPIANFAIFGYQIQVARNVAVSIEDPDAAPGSPLPDWNDFGRLLADGLRFMAVFLVYLLPIILLVVCASISILALTASDPSAYSSAGTPPPPEFFALFGLMLACMMPYTLVLYVLWPLFGIQIARQGSVGSCFRVSEMWQLVRAQPTNYILIVLLLFGLYMAVSLIILPTMVVVLIPCIGYFIYLGIAYGAMMLVLMVVGHLQGQFIAGGKGMEPGQESNEPELA